MFDSNGAHRINTHQARSHTHTQTPALECSHAHETFYLHLDLVYALYVFKLSLFLTIIIIACDWKFFLHGQFHAVAQAHVRATSLLSVSSWSWVSWEQRRAFFTFLNQMWAIRNVYFSFIESFPCFVPASIVRFIRWLLLFFLFLQHFVSIELVCKSNLNERNGKKIIIVIYSFCYVFIIYN